MLKRIRQGLLFLICVMAFTGLPVRAGVVKSVESGSGARSDYHAIMKELEKTGYVRLVKGQTYNLGSHVLHVKSNWAIDATGATIKGKNCLLLNIPGRTNFKAIENFRVTGGTWISTKKKGVKKSAIKITHGKNITFSNMKMRWCNINSHSIELVACKNVKIYNCDIDGLGKAKSKSVEEAIQIDLAAPKTAPFLKEYRAKSLGLWNGAACDNVVISKCRVRGCRGICANFAANDAKAGRKQYLKKFHKNITITNNVIIGDKSEGLALFNVLAARVNNNRIYTSSRRYSSPYSTGCHIVLIGKIPAGSEKFKLSITGNKIHGGNRALSLGSQSSSNFYKVSLKYNKFYCKRGAGEACSVNKVTHFTKKGNRSYKW